METMDLPAVMTTGLHPLAGIDEDIEADLAALGISLTPDIERELEQERRIAMAATLFRRAQGMSADLAETERPERVRVTVTMPLTEALAYFTETELERSASIEVEWNKLKPTLDPEQPLPPGVSLVPARREPYAKLVATLVAAD